MTNQHKRDRFHEDTWIDRDRCTYPTNQHKCPMVVHLFFFEFYIFLTSVLRSFQNFWEILRNFERFWEILRNFEKFWEIFTSPSNTTFQLQWFPCLWFWEILRNFEKILASFFLFLFSRFDLLPPWDCRHLLWQWLISHAVSLILAGGVAVAATPWQLTPLHHEEKTPVTVPLCFTYNVCCESSSILYQDLKTFINWVLWWMTMFISTNIIYMLVHMCNCILVTLTCVHRWNEGLQSTHPALRHWIEHMSHECDFAIY